MNATDHLETLERRLDSLEKQNHRMKSVLLGLCVLASLPYLMAAATEQKTVQAESVKAQRCELMMEDKVVFTIKGLKTDHGNALALHAESGKLNAAFVDAKNGGDLHIYNKDEKIAGFLFARESGGGDLAINGSNEKVVAALYARTNGGGVEIYNNDSKIVASVHPLNEGGALQINDNNNKPMSWLFARTDGGALQVNNKDSKTVGWLYSDADGGFLNILNRDGRGVAAALFARPNGSGNLNIFNESGKIAGTLNGNLNGGGILGIANRNGTSVAELRSDSGSLDSGMMAIYNRDGKTVGLFATNAHGSGVSIHGNDEKALAVLGARADGGKLNILSPTGQLRFSAP